MKQTKKPYEEPTIEIISLEVNDILMTSVNGDSGVELPIDPFD